MLVAEEPDARLDQVGIMAAPIDKIFGNLAVLRENLPFHPDERGNVKDAAQWVLGKIGRELGIMFTGGSVESSWEASVWPGLSVCRYKPSLFIFPEG